MSTPADLSALTLREAAAGIAARAVSSRELTEAALARLASGVILKDGPTLPAKARCMDEPELWPRTPPVRFRREIPTSWIELTILEGRKRQVRHMTAAVGFPTLRLVRVKVGTWTLGRLQPGEWREWK